MGDSTPGQQQTVKHVLKISSDDKKHDYYSVGFYDTDTDTYEPASPRLDTGIGLRYDYGKFYASKSFFDPSTSRRILLGWSNESDSIQADISKGWSSIQVKKVIMFLVHLLDLMLH
jgi:beta-fructofuranosidase